MKRRVLWFSFRGDRLAISSRSLGRLFLTVAMSGLAISPVGAERPAAQQPANPDAKPIADFLGRVNEYVALHQKFEKAAPKLPKEATPQQIDQNQRALAARIQSARAVTKRGDIFTPEMTALVKRVLSRVFAGPEGRQLRNSIMDENVAAIPLNVNQRYPDTIPLTSMPPEVLKALPELPEDMEYRFLGDHLILLDPHADIIPDFIPDALPDK
jgi:hypothetical protein